jgi:PAS domain S-box-containing protein
MKPKRSFFLPITLLYLFAVSLTVFPHDEEIQISFPFERYDQEWLIQNYIEEAGLQNQNILFLDFEKSGTVWIAASNGLYRFDGYEWDRYSVENGLPSNFVRCVRMTDNGDLWVGTDKGAGIFIGESFHSQGAENGLAGPQVRRIIEDVDGSLWFCCDQWPNPSLPSGLTRYHKGEWTTFTEKDGLPSNFVSDYFRDSKGRQFAITKSGIARFENQRWIPSLTTGEFSQINWSSACIAESPKLGVLFSTGKEIYVLDEEHWIRKNSRYVHSYGICGTRDNKIFVCGNISRGKHAFLEWDGEDFEIASSTFRSPVRNYMEAVREAPDGSIWGFGHNFLVRWERGNSEWREYKNLPPPFFEDNQSRLWFVERETIIRIEGDQWEQVEHADTIFRLDHEKNIWGFSNNRVTKWSRNGVETFNRNDIDLQGINGANVDAIGRIWIYGKDENDKNAFSIFDGSTWKIRIIPELQEGRIDKSDSDPGDGIWYLITPQSPEVRFLAHVTDSFVNKQIIPHEASTVFTPDFLVDSSNNIWLYGDYGLYAGQENRKKWQRISNLPGSHISACYEREDEVWFACQGATGGKSGLVRFKNGEWKTFEADLHYSSSQAFDDSIYFGGEGKIYIISEESGWEPKQLTLPIKDIVSRIMKDRNGNLWIGVGETVLRFKADRFPPKTELIYATNEIPQNGRLHVEFNGRERFVPRNSPGITYRFSWRIDSSPWTEFDHAPANGIALSGLAPGNHALEVLAQDESFTIESTPTRLEFTVIPIPLQNRIWFKPVVLGIFLLLLLLAAHAIHSRKKLASFAGELQHLVDQRTMELRSSEELYRQTLSSISDTILLTDDNGKFTFVSPNAGNIFEYTLAEIQEFKTISVLLGRNLFDQALLDVTDEIPNIECEIRNKSGKQRSLLINIKRVNIAGGTLLYTCRDITAWQQVKNSLRDSEERFRTAFENAAIGMSLTGTDGRFLKVNQALCDMVGYSLQELQTMNYKTIAYPDDLQNSQECMRSLLSGEHKSHLFEERYLHKHGHVIWTIVSTSLMRDAHQTPLYFITQIQEITQRKQAEEKIIQARDFYLKLFDNFPAMIWRSGPDAKCDYFNKAWLDFTGRAMEQEIGDGWAEGVHSDDFSLCLDTYQNAFHNREPFEMEYRLRHYDGEYRMIVDIASPFENLDGHFAGYVGACYDITDRKKLENQLRQSQKMESIGQLAGGIAHDFNNLLMAIMGYSSLAMRNLPSSDPICADIAEIQKAGTRAAALTNQLLAFSRKQVLQPKILNLNDSILDTDKMLRRLIGEHIEYITIPMANLGHVKADAGQIEQIIMNLAVNARDAMPNGGKLTIETQNIELDTSYCRQHMDVQSGPYVMLAVSDTGHGMDQQTQNQIFDPFFTTKELGKGTGLGLSTVYGIVKQSGGHIYVYSVPGQGTTFKIYLPRVDEPGEVIVPPRASIASMQGTETILLVEDEEIVRSLISRTLRENGYSVIDAGYGSEALEKCNHYPDPIHLLLTDIIMPKMSGRELADCMIQSHPNIKILYMSGYTDNGIIHHGILDQDVYFLQKPFTSEALLQKIREVLNDVPT